MKVALRKIEGNWDLGYSLDKHVISSKPSHYNEHGHLQFDTLRTEPGEALYQLKYKQDWSKVEILAEAIKTNICPYFSNVGLIIPTPPSKVRIKQPVFELAKALAIKMGVSSFENILSKQPTVEQLKDMATKQQKVQLLKNSLKVTDGIEGTGPWNALVLDDLYDTGASLEAVCAALKTYSKIKKIYVATVTWK